MSEQDRMEIDARSLHEQANEFLQKSICDLADASLLRHLLRQQADRLQHIGHFETALALRHDENAIGERQLATDNYAPEGEAERD
jgi:hypothetical protein